jgi:hypothetical protein
MLSQSANAAPGVAVKQSFDYDSRGNLLSRTDCNGNVVKSRMAPGEIAQQPALSRKRTGIIPDGRPIGPPKTGVPPPFMTNERGARKSPENTGNRTGIIRPKATSAIPVTKRKKGQA